MTSQESSVNDATLKSVTLGSTIMILEVSFALIYDVYSTSISYDDCQLMIIIVYSTGHREETQHTASHNQRPYKHITIVTDVSRVNSE